VFSNGDIGKALEIKNIFDEEIMTNKNIKEGWIYQDDVWLKEGPTGLEPSKTIYFL
jgi:hypothetical protein